MWYSFVEHLRIHVCHNEQYIPYIPLDYSKVDVMLRAFAVEVAGGKKYICAMTKTLKMVYIMLMLDTMLMLKKYVCAYQMYYF